jgi:hypothetical protein
MNYILHLNSCFEKTCEDERLSPFHISLYYCLFQFWNQARFRNPISVNRYELMRASKIGSVNTYIRCMKELDHWQYIKYEPSFNPHKGSQVHLFSFNNTNDKAKSNGSDISNNKGTGKASEKGGSKAPETVLIPYINNSNSTNNLNKTKRVNGKIKNSRSLATKKSISYEKSKSQDSDPASAKIQVQKKVSARPEPVEGPRGSAAIEPSPGDLQEKANNNPEEASVKESDTKPSEDIERIQDLRSEASNKKQGTMLQSTTPGFKRPLLQQVKDHFIQKGWPALEAEKYFNHYQSNGWLVGGKSPMADWHASAEKWILNSKNFNYEKSFNTFPGRGNKPQAGHLNTNQDKNYTEPL